MNHLSFRSCALSSYRRNHLTYETNLVSVPHTRYSVATKITEANYFVTILTVSINIGRILFTLQNFSLHAKIKTDCILRADIKMWNVFSI